VGLRERIWHRWLRRPYVLTKVFDTGSGEPVVLLHGLATSSQTWRPLIKPLQKRNWRIIAFDLLGFGVSPKPDWPDYDVHTHSRSVLASLERLKLSEPVTIVGHSMGCLVAAHIAATQPRLVKRLVLYEPPLYADLPEFAGHMKDRDRYFRLYERVAASPKLVLRSIRVMGLMATKLAGFSLTQDNWYAFERSLRNTIMRQRAYDDLRGITVPTQIIYGRLDLVVANKEVKKLFERNPHISFHAVNDVHGVSFWSGRFLANLLEKGRAEYTKN